MTGAVAEKKETKSKKEKVLVIVESPAKSKTIKKILGDGYQIEASFGRVRNYPIMFWVLMCITDLNRLMLLFQIRKK